jgi:hypothetical protein
MSLIYHFIAYLVLPTFFIISIYNIAKLDVDHQENLLLRDSVNIAIECMFIFIGSFLGMIYLSKKITTEQINFCGHISLFLIMTGIFAIVPTAKRIENTRK